MLSTPLELAGFAAIVAGVYILAGLGIALLVLGACLLFVGYGTDDAAAASAVLNAARAPGRRLRARRARSR